MNDTKELKPNKNENQNAEKFLSTTMTLIAS